MARPADFSPTNLLAHLAGGGIDFVVVGGVAVALQAQVRFTQDLDVCYAPDSDNLTRLGEVLLGLRGRLRGVSDDVPFAPDERTLRQTQILTLDTDEGPLDLLVDPPGAPPYAELRARASVMDMGAFAIRVASIRDMLAMKRACGRPQDLVDVESLQIARRRQGRRSAGR